MIHSQKTKQLSRERKGRSGLLRTLAVSLIRDEKIKTTETKAKVLKPLVEKMITKAKVGGVSARRFLDAKVGPVSSKKLVEVTALKYKDRQGGYLRITKLNDRKNDGAKVAQIEFV
ncbi:MAG: 50S ribosomal protein L17 [Candidatus Taylorbacteria bacterium RIFOXYD2_FULL_36_9]|uniref:50S ribosomal protein L17 n=1 Tax=Candidatus Taylorbacteria bacterium RIFOXYD2_FULL_36_9 TaxID=1802338 RepID=A0A1G2PFV4_9BACT|nr:MAG: 50S ribosomal protein L17 [Candidatus Taylorbacteria bacterium RIFOXYD2_FULL_36_9]